MLRGRDVDKVIGLKRQGLSIRAISRMTGYDRKTIGRYLAAPDSRPVYGPRAPAESKLGPFKAYLMERLRGLGEVTGVAHSEASCTRITGKPKVTRWGRRNVPIADMPGDR